MSASARLVLTTPTVPLRMDSERRPLPSVSANGEVPCLGQSPLQVHSGRYSPSMPFNRSRKWPIPGAIYDRQRPPPSTGLQHDTIHSLSSDSIRSTTSLPAEHDTPAKRGTSIHQQAQEGPTETATREDSLPTASSSSRTGPSRRATHAERARENKLRSDPIAIVHNAQLVECRRCATMIKLSLKSQFDPAHWQKHRERCLRRSDTVVEGMRNSKERRPVRTSERRPEYSLTPPLTPDADSDIAMDDAGARCHKEDSPLTQLEEGSSRPGSLEPAPSTAASAARLPEPVSEDSVVQSPPYSLGELSQAFYSWQDWRWSQLRTSAWATKVYPDVDGVDDDDDEDDDESAHRFALSAIRDIPNDRLRTAPQAANWNWHPDQPS